LLAPQLLQAPKRPQLLHQLQLLSKWNIYCVSSSRWQSWTCIGIERLEEPLYRPAQHNAHW